MKMSSSSSSSNDIQKKNANNNNTVDATTTTTTTEEDVIPFMDGYYDMLTMEDRVLLFQLHRLLQMADMSMLLRKLKEEIPRKCADVSVYGFCHLFGSDTSFGSFGTPIAREDDRLSIVALTSFDVYESAILTRTHDVMTILTPLYRVLFMVQLCLAKIHEVDDAFKQADVCDFLPYKPAALAPNRSRYASFLDVILSVWTHVCHAYIAQTSRVWPEQPGRLQPLTVIQELHCFNVHGTRNKHVWFDVNIAQLKALEFGKTMTGADFFVPWITLKTTTYDVGHKIVIVLKNDDDDDDGDDEASDLIAYLVYVFTVDTVQGIYRTSSTSPIAIPKGMIYVDKLSDEYNAVVVVSFRVITPAPGFALTAVDGDDQFLLLTLNGGEYSAFYRNAGNQDICPYPLYIHPQPPSKCRFKVDCARCARPYDFEFDYSFMSFIAFQEQPKYCSNACLQGKLFGSPSPSKIAAGTRQKSQPKVPPVNLKLYRPPPPKKK